jgi:hypothetical protein
MNEERLRCLQIIDNTLRYHEARGSALVVAVLKNLRARVKYGNVTTRSSELQAQPCADSTSDNTLQQP